MKWKIANDWNGLSLRIIALFATAMLVSYSPDYLRDFFEDQHYSTNQSQYGRGFFDCSWSWGYRHYLYWWMCVALFVTQAVRLFTWIIDNKREWKP